MTTENNRIGDRLGVAGGLEKESTTGIGRDGMADPTGEYPLRTNWFNSSISSSARGLIVNELWLGGSTMGVSFDIPFPSPSIFPFNQSNTTPSGHSFEIDDTPGNQRILIKHHTGAGVELKQDGSVAVVSRAHQVQVVGADHELVVSGQGNITYNGDMNLTVNGDYNVDVGGTYNVRVGSNYNHSVSGSHLTEVGDVHSTLVRGNKDVKVWGDTFNFYSSELKVVTKKDIRNITEGDFIVNSHKDVRMTAQGNITATTAKNLVLSGKDVRLLGGQSGKIGGPNFQYMGNLYTGPPDDNGKETVFQGNLVGRALEAWTSKFSLYSRESYYSHIANYATVAEWADLADEALFQTYASDDKGALTGSKYLWEGGDAQDGSPDLIVEPTYDFKWGWNVDGRTTHDISQSQNDDQSISPNFVTPIDWWELYNKVSPYAVRNVVVDYDNNLEYKISKRDEYSMYFSWTPSLSEIRSKLRVMDGAQDRATSPEFQTNGTKCIQSLLKENRLSATWSQRLPAARFETTRTGKSVPEPRFGYTLLGNPLERSSKTFTPKNRNSSTRTILADPIYNPDRHTSPITSSTKLSRSTSISKFLGAPGSRCSLDAIPLIQTRQDLARQWYLHAMLMEGVSTLKNFSSYRLQVTEGYYKPSKGIREGYLPSESVELQQWREPFKASDSSGIQRSVVAGTPSIAELKHNGRAVVYTLYNSSGKVDMGATFDLSLHIRDMFFYDQLSLDYDECSPEGDISQQIIVVMPEITPSFEATFEMKVCSYYNRSKYGGSDLVEITASSSFGTEQDSRPPAPPRRDEENRQPIPTEPMGVYDERFGVSQEKWASRAQVDDLITVPAGETIVSSKFVTSDDPNHGVRISFEPTGETANSLMNVWVSTSPASTPISEDALKTNQSNLFNYDVKQDISRIVRGATTLDTSTTYYFNMQNMSASSGESSYKRTLMKNLSSARVPEQEPPPPQGPPIDQSPSDGVLLLMPYNSIPDSEMFNTIRYESYYAIPDGRVVSERFKTTQSLTAYGQMVFHEVAGDAYNPAVNFWISEQPNGAPVSEAAYWERAMNVSAMRWTTIPGGDGGPLAQVILEPDKTYYLNVENHDIRSYGYDSPQIRDGEPRIWRWVRNLGL